MALLGGDWSSSARSALTAVKEGRVPNEKEAGLATETGWDFLRRAKSLASGGNRKPTHPSHHYTDYATPTPPKPAN